MRSAEGREQELVMADNEEVKSSRSKQKKERKSVFDKWSEKLKDFLDNAE